MYLISIAVNKVILLIHIYWALKCSVDIKVKNPKKMKKLICDKALFNFLLKF